MILTKFNQSCLLIETNEKRILVDLGNIGYNDELLNNYWINIDYILITHKHLDHCLDEAINTIIERDNAILYTTEEVNNTHNLAKVNIVKKEDFIDLGNNIKVEVVHAIHGYLTKFRGNAVKQNVGYIIDDGQVRLYTTSDTIAFENDYNCDVICMPFNGNDLTMGIQNSVNYAKDTGAKLVLPIHTEHPDPKFNPDINMLKNELEKQDMKYRILDLKESIDI